MIIVTLMLFQFFLYFWLQSKQPQKGWFKYANLSLPISIGFIYTAVVQVFEALKNPSEIISQDTVEAALFVALVAHFTFAIGYLLPLNGKHSKPTVKQYEKIRIFAGVLLMIGIVGKILYIREVGGLDSYYGFQDWQRNIFSTMSAYLYNLPYVTFAGLGLLSFLWVSDELDRKWKIVFVVCTLWVAVDALQWTDRSDIVRAIMPVLPVIIAGRHAVKKSLRLGIFKNLKVMTILCLICVSVIVAPQFRDSGRRFLQSEVSLADALTAAYQGGFSSRFSSARGGEFDTAVRLVDAVDSGMLEPVWGSHFALTIWGFVPRHLIPDKHHLFNKWVNPEHHKIESYRSYQGCATTGWGEAYAQFGGFHFVYWLMLGVLLRRLQRRFPDKPDRLVVTACSFMSLAQLVIMGFWIGFMNTFYVVLPILWGLAYFRSDRLKTPVGNTRLNPDIHYRQRG